MARLAIPAILLAMLGACGPKGPDGANQTIANANLDDLTGAAACDARPAHAPIYADAKITACTAGAISATSKVSGTIIYESAALPAAILAWSKVQATKEGLSETLSNDMTWSASKGDSTVMVMAMPKGSGSQVTVNWGRAP